MTVSVSLTIMGACGVLDKLIDKDFYMTKGGSNQPGGVAR